MSGYIESLYITCGHGLYSIYNLEKLSSNDLSNITEFYVGYYLANFIIRVKTGTEMDDGYPFHIQLPLPKAVIRGKPLYFNPANPLVTLTKLVDDEPLGQFLVKIKSKSLSKYFISINTLTLCNEIWKMWSDSTEKILNLCKEDLLASLRSVKQFVS